jgi:HK97 family phage major capsid protein
MNIDDAAREILRTNGIFKFVDDGPTSLNNGVLQTAKLGSFIKAMKDATVLLDAASMEPMDSDTKDIDRIDQEVELESPTRAEDGTITLTDQDPDFACNTLIAKKFRARTRVTQDALDVNIEGQGLMNTIQTVFGGACGRATERVYIYGDTTQTGGSIPSGYKAIDGWIKCVDDDNVLYGGGTAQQRDFDPDDIDDIFTKMKDAQNGAYVDQSVFFVPPLKAVAYQRSLKSKDSNLGDQANLSAGQLTFEGRPVVPVPALEWKHNNPTFFGPEDPMFFGRAEDFKYGMFKTVQLRVWEDIDNELWKIRYGFKSDVNFTDETKVILGLPAETAA